MIKSNQTCLISAILGEREREECHQRVVKLWLVPPRTGAERESGHGRGTPRGGTGRSNRGTFSSFCFKFFSSSCPINFSSPPTFQLSQINVSLLFIYMNIYINKYRIFRLFSHFGDCYHCIFFSSPSNFVSDSQDILITVIKHDTHKHIHMHMVHSQSHSCISFQPCLCHPHTSPSLQLTQVMHSKGPTQLSCWSPMKTTALNLILWHH